MTNVTRVSDVAHMLFYKKKCFIDDKFYAYIYKVLIIFLFNKYSLKRKSTALAKRQSFMLETKSLCTNISKSKQ